MADSGEKSNHLQDAGLSMPAVTKAPAKDAPVVPGDKSNQIPAKPQVVKQDLGTEMSSRTHASPNGSRLGGRQTTVAGRETSYVNQSGKEEPVPADRKAATAPGAKAAVPVRPETTAPVSSEPVIAGRLSDTARMSADSAVVERPTQTIGEQILDSVRASIAREDNQLLIRLHPPELGTVLVRFREQEGHISGLVEVAESDTRRQIEQALPQVLRSLQDAGVEIQKLEVVTAGPSEGELGRGPAHQGTGSPPDGGGQEGEHPVPSPARRWQSRESSPANPQELPGADAQVHAAHGRVDVLL